MITNDYCLATRKLLPSEQENRSSRQGSRRRCRQTEENPCFRYAATVQSQIRFETTRHRAENDSSAGHTDMTVDNCGPYRCRCRQLELQFSRIQGGLIILATRSGLTWHMHANRRASLVQMRRRMCSRRLRVHQGPDGFLQFLVHCLDPHRRLHDPL